MSFPNKPYKALQDLLGKEFISRDPAVTMAYSRCFASVKSSPPSCIVLPGKAGEIQEIFRLANIYDFKVIPTGTHLMATCEPTLPDFDYVIIDPKRMDELEIDADNMYAIVQPYVTFARLQMEAMKHGLTCYIPSGGSQTSVLANQVFQGFNMQSYRLGAGSRSMLAMEWVLPNGELMHTGSASLREGDYFWGEGPGPDLRGMLKGTWGFFGGIGMCTRIGVKLHAWNGPEIFPCEGTTPDKRCHLPSDVFRTFAIDFSSVDKVINAMYDIGHAEIASRCIHLRKGWIPCEISLSQEHFWDIWESAEYQKAYNNLVVVILEAYTAEEQLDYEEEVLRQIVAEQEGRFLTGELLESVETIVAPDLLIRPSLVFRGFRVGGNFMSVKLGLDSLDHSALLLKNGIKLTNWFIKDKIPPFVDVQGEAAYINPYDFGHMGHLEFPILYEASPDNVAIAMKLVSLQMLEDIYSRTYPGGFLFSIFMDVMGPMMGKFNRIVGKVKVAFDPNNISNPPWPKIIWKKTVPVFFSKYITYAQMKLGMKKDENV